MIFPGGYGILPPVGPILTLPNLLSFLRLLMIPLLILFIIHVNEAVFPLLMGLYVFTVFLDFLDGFLARRFRLESNLGKVLDPLADKVLVLALLIVLTVRADFPLWLAVLIFSRDALILVASILLYHGRHVIKPALVIGKFTFGLLSLLIFIFLLDLSETWDMSALKQFLITLSLSFLLWSWAAYFLVYLREKDARRENHSGG